MKIYRVNNKYYKNKEIAFLQGVKENYAIITIEVNETQQLEVEKNEDDLLLIDDKGNEYSCECDFYLEDHVTDICHITNQQETEKYYNYTNIQIERKSIEHFNLDPVTIEQINNEFEDICQMKTEDSI
tara:strand:- start:4558 stop:4941 length:384 start_codon:yes stop_codon:yes gene_type:complete